MASGTSAKKPRGLFLYFFHVHVDRDSLPQMVSCQCHSDRAAVLHRFLPGEGGALERGAAQPLPRRPLGVPQLRRAACRAGGPRLRWRGGPRPSLGPLTAEPSCRLHASPSPFPVPPGCLSAPFRQCQCLGDRVVQWTPVWEGMAAQLGDAGWRKRCWLPGLPCPRR